MYSNDLEDGENKQGISERKQYNKVREYANTQQVFAKTNSLKQKSMRIIFLLFTTLVTLSACNKKVKETIGIVIPGPDEYRVQRNKTLEVPPHYELPSIEKKDTKSHKIHSPKNLNDGEQALIEDMEN
ncbi:MAG: hypothetical protein DMENIID0002_06660 [Rickettsia endosymbiont of Sergentomyia squamirostris]|uniref:Lipoprotein n=1 Tax=Candidatus Tisiphia endosymbiont of Sergentomyia squamirostris TaxID=3113639 RepID=A0AAT9G8C0_9RICK